MVAVPVDSVTGTAAFETFAEFDAVECAAVQPPRAIVSASRPFRIAWVVIESPSRK
jgi:hypothetical protein